MCGVVECKRWRKKKKTTTVRSPFCLFVSIFGKFLHSGGGGNAIV